VVTSAMLSRQIIPSSLLRIELNALSTHSYALFVAPEEVNPHRINGFRTLCAKHRGWGVPSAATHCPFRCSTTTFCRPLFSQPYELLFPQLPSFHNHPHCAGVWGHVAPAALISCKSERIATPSKPPSPFNAVFRHSMHGNTVQRNVWSHTAKSGKLFFVTEGLGGQSY
jgi:hypothetical protein